MGIEISKPDIHKVALIPCRNGKIWASNFSLSPGTYVSSQNMISGIRYSAATCFQLFIYFVRHLHSSAGLGPHEEGIY